MSALNLLSTQAAADRLHELLPHKDAAQWSRWLSNNRFSKRAVNYRIPFERISGGVFYRPEDLRAFADYENKRRIGNQPLSTPQRSVLEAFGIGEAGGGATGRKWCLSTIMPQVDAATGQHFIQLTLSDPLRVYRLEVDQAQDAIALLQDAVDYCTGKQSPATSRRRVMD